MVPQKLEQQIRLELPCVRHAVIVGDGEDYVSVLLTVQTMVEDDAASAVQSPRLTEEAARWFKVCTEIQENTRVRLRDSRVNHAT